MVELAAIKYFLIDICTFDIIQTFIMPIKSITTFELLVISMIKYNLNIKILRTQEVSIMQMNTNLPKEVKITKRASISDIEYERIDVEGRSKDFEWRVIIFDFQNSFYYSYIILGSHLGCSSFELKYKIGDVRNPQDDVIRNSK